MTSEKVFQKFVPPNAVTYCNQLYRKLNFEFKVKRPRQTKFGDYRFDLRTGKKVISINNNLNPYAFLITYLHEIAHLVAFEKYGRKIKPHGREWKEVFVMLAKPMMSENVFPKPVLNALENYFKNPKATSCSDPDLYQVLKRFDGDKDIPLLKDIAINETFQFNGRLFLKLEKKRTRSLCQEVGTDKRYYIAEIAEVIKGS